MSTSATQKERGAREGILGIRVTEEERKQMEAGAAAEHMPVSVYVRRLALTAASRRDLLLSLSAQERRLIEAEAEANHEPAADFVRRAVLQLIERRAAKRADAAA